MHITSQFDAGAIDIIAASQPDNIRLNIRADNACEFRQWFYFRVHDVRDTALILKLENASTCTYAQGWEGYQAVASYDRQHWFRIKTEYDGQMLTLRHTPTHNDIYIAYFAPYSYEQHLDLIALASTHAEVSNLGNSIEGRPIDCISWGTGRLPVWIIARQHPGETMTEWLIEGLLHRLFDRFDSVARQLAEFATLHIVPNMNPDGAIHGNLRSNAAGVNLNREWMYPSLTHSPEVHHVRNAMHNTGVALFLDIHGDETIPHVFTDGCEMLPDYSTASINQQRAFTQLLATITPDFQTEHGYAPDRFSDEMLTLASKYVGHTFGCVSLTLEMPFKDHNNLPEPIYGWSPVRSQQLGRDLCVPILLHCLSTDYNNA
ncbi:MAG: carboxypeptidase family protein [Sulfuriferula sp.]|nr:carboxypeptidase family protein [Sulfuriferula sp.]